MLQKPSNTQFIVLNSTHGLQTSPQGRTLALKDGRMGGGGGGGEGKNHYDRIKLSKLLPLYPLHRNAQAGQKTKQLPVNP